MDERLGRDISVYKSTFENQFDIISSYFLICIFYNALNDLGRVSPANLRVNNGRIIINRLL